MKAATKTIWIMGCVAVFISMIWYIISSTAMFQKDIELVTMILFLLLCVPALLFVIVSTIALIKGWLPEYFQYRVLFLVGIILISFFFCVTFIRYSNADDWMEETVTRDYLQTTSDQKYEYRVELVDMDQRNSTARLYIKDIFTREETYIPLDISKSALLTMTGGENSTLSRKKKLPVWSELAPSDTENVYILTTTKHLNKLYTYIFEVDMNLKIAEKQSYVK